MKMTPLLRACLLMAPFTVSAGDVEIVMTTFEKQGPTWVVNTTLKHEDTGWEHYADAWRVVSEDGKEIARRTLYHPHENEQPFTRSLGDIKIPPGATAVYVEAHDKVHGWSPQRVRVDLTKKRGERYKLLP